VDRLYQASLTCAPLEGRPGVAGDATLGIWRNTMKTLVLLAGLLASSVAAAQYSQQPQSGGVSYNYLEVRFVDVDSNGGDGLRFGGSFDFGNNWLLVGSVTALEFNNDVDATVFEMGGGYVWNYTGDFDLLATAQYVHIDVSGGGDVENGVRFSAGTRGLITPKFEIRGFLNHTTAGDSDTYLEMAGDYYFSRQFAAGLSFEFAGDNDVITVGGRWFFK
jgi:hypothetical protein